MSFAYLTAWAFALSIALGALIFVAIAHATQARWMRTYLPMAGRLTGTLPVIALLFVPIALSLDTLYPWTDLSRFHGEDLAKLVHKARWLSPTFWIVRSVIYLAILGTFGELLIRRPSRALACAALPVLALTLTFGAFDWLMSLTPLWYSTIYGLTFWGGGFVGALALLAVLTRADSRLGRLLFAMLVFWAYLEFSQGVIIWLANKPDEAVWYVARGAGAWSGVFAVLGLAGFALPFLVLMPAAVKARPRVLAVIGAWLVAMHYLDIAFLIMPSAHRGFVVWDVLAPLIVLPVVALVAWRRS